LKEGKKILKFALEGCTIPTKTELYNRRKLSATYLFTALLFPTYLHSTNPEVIVQKGKKGEKTTPGIWVTKEGRCAQVTSWCTKEVKSMAQQLWHTGLICWQSWNRTAQLRNAGGRVLGEIDTQYEVPLEQPSRRTLP
jgi:hypothetical protein